MNPSALNSHSDYKNKLKWLLFFRILFSTLLLGSTIILQLGEKTSPFAPSLIVLYGIIITIFFLSLIYGLLLKHIKRDDSFALLQILVDTVIVSLVIFVTGSFLSVFSFLYLVVLIYSSMMLSRRTILVIAAVCSIQFGIMVDLEYYGILTPFGMKTSHLAATFAWNEVLYKVLITMMACFAVAFLSSLLSEQTRKTKKELQAMEDHVKRVEKMAAIGEMAAGLAHEIKNPLASLSGSIQLLKEDIRYDPDHDRLMQIILREADRLSLLVSNFLLYARPPAGKVEPVELDKVLIETTELFEKDGSTDGRISTTTNIESGIWIEIDPVHLRQILWNLLLNAAEAINGVGNISIEMHGERNKDAWVEIIDDGCGMSKKTLKSIFDPFFTTKSSGTGLGLSIVHRILQAYDSRLDVDSEPSKGTRVTLKFKQINPPG
ncbi:MAG: ATP-binding protein [Desulfobacterales bacterium]|jgi:two-component system sensor histidine kinase PilS (NtrC family)